MNKNGFTLIELLVVIGIIGILIAVGTLDFRDMTVKSNVEGQVREMYADLMVTRVQAMSRNRDHFVRLNNAAQYTAVDDSDNDGINDMIAPDTQLYQKSLKYPIQWNSAVPGNVDLIFDSKGLADSAGLGTISVPNTAGAAYDCIVIDITRIYIGKMSGGSCVQK